jgi:hypothetical protein
MGNKYISLTLDRDEALWLIGLLRRFGGGSVQKAMIHALEAETEQWELSQGTIIEDNDDRD